MKRSLNLIKLYPLHFNPTSVSGLTTKASSLQANLHNTRCHQFPTDEEAEAEAPTVLPSSADLFIVYRQMLAQTAKLSSGTALVDLSKLFAKYLNIYLV